MPVYEYRCLDCRRTFSRLQRMGATADGVRCPHCAGERVERRLSSFASADSGSTSRGCGTAASGST